TPMCSGPPITGLGRTYTRTLATRLSAARRARCAKGATAFRRWPGVLELSRVRGTTISVGASISWQRSPRSPASSCRKRIARANPWSSTGYDMSPLLFGQGTWSRETWFYFTEDELTPGAVRYRNYKFVFNLRGDDGAHTGWLAVDS